MRNDIESLKRLVRESREALRNRDLQIEHLKLMLAKLRRMQFGRSSEALDERIEQLETNGAKTAIGDSLRLTSQDPGRTRGS
jgi:hypothetical protein